MRFLCGGGMRIASFCMSSSWVKRSSFLPSRRGRLSLRRTCPSSEGQPAVCDGGAGGISAELLESFSVIGVDDALCVEAVAEEACLALARAQRRRLEGMSASSVELLAWASSNSEPLQYSNPCA